MFLPGEGARLGKAESDPEVRDPWDDPEMCQRIVGNWEDPWKEVMPYKEVMPRRKVKRIEWLGRTAATGGDINEVEQKDVVVTKGDWVKIPCTIDSGAIGHVTPKKALPEVPIRPNKMSREGITYKAANNTDIKNHGE